MKKPNLLKMPGFQNTEYSISNIPIVKEIRPIYEESIYQNQIVEKDENVQIIIKDENFHPKYSQYENKKIANNTIYELSNKITDYKELLKLEENSIGENDEDSYIEYKADENYDDLSDISVN
jgi:TPP-dependent indolepyruvate ferredoxin oxidoreductase alpha subunit